MFHIKLSRMLYTHTVPCQVVKVAFQKHEISHKKATAHPMYHTAGGLPDSWQIVEILGVVDAPVSRWSSSSSAWHIGLDVSEMETRKTRDRLLGRVEKMPLLWENASATGTAVGNRMLGDARSAAAATSDCELTPAVSSLAAGWATDYTQNTNILLFTHSTCRTSMIQYSHETRVLALTVAETTCLTLIWWTTRFNSDVLYQKLLIQKMICRSCCTTYSVFGLCAMQWMCLRHGN